MKLRHARAISTWRLAELLRMPIARDARHAVNRRHARSTTVALPPCKRWCRIFW